MVRKLLNFLYRETSSLNQAALLLGLFAFLSQVLAFLRDRLLAHIFGASTELDIYYAAFRIPDFIFVAVASLVSLSVLIPFIIDREAEGIERVKDFVSNVFSFFSILIVGVSILVFFLIPMMSGFLFKGFTPEALREVIMISRVLLLSPIILGTSNLFASLTQAYNRFALYALAPLLYNAGIIAGTIFLTTHLGVSGVAIGVIMGALLHLLIQLPFVIKSGLLPRFSFSFDFAVIARVAKISLPRTLTLSMSSIGMIFLVSLATLMSAGSVSILSFSFNLQSIPLSIIGVSYSLAAFPTLSRRFQENNLGSFKKQMAVTARLVIFWSLPISALFIVLRAHIVRVILGSGLFNWEATRLTSAALALFSLSVMFQSLLILFMRGFYSAGQTKKPFVINLFSTIILVVSSWGLVKLFYASDVFRHFISALLKVEDLSATAVLMLPLGFSFATIVNGLLHWVAFEREFKGFSLGVVKTFFHCFETSVIVGFVTYLSLNFFAPFFDTASLVGILSQGVIAGLLGILAGIVVLTLLRNKELKDVWSAVRARFWKAEVLATDPEIV